MKKDNSSSKTLYIIIFIILVLTITFVFRENIMIFYVENFGNGDINVKLDYKNEYYKEYDYNYLSLTDDFLINNKNEIINIYYTIVNSGINKFTFYCSQKYDNCIQDVIEIASNQTTLSNINSFVHPFNSFSTVETKYDSTGKIKININKAYTEEQINTINNKIDEIMEDKLKNITDNKEKIRIIHDYIINNSKYDSDKSDKKINKYFSDIAYGPLLQGYGLCGGYTDAMALFLNRFNVPNFKVLSENHVWNAVYIDDNWYHLDLTWDDPVVSDGTETLEYSFFLITNEELEALQTNQHSYDKTVFTELQK